MFKNDSLIIEILGQIFSAVTTIHNRFSPVKSVDDFTNSPEGMEKLDSICMLFIAIGEALKEIDKLTNNELLLKYNEINWKGIKGFRDILSHHYFDVDAEQVFWLCQNELNPLKSTIQKIISELQ